MGVLGPVLAVDDAWARGADDRYYGGPGLISPMAVTPDAAMTIPAFYAGVTYISEDVAKVPLNMFEDLGEEGSRKARDHELQELLHDQPNGYQTSLMWREMVTAIAMLRGRCVNEIRSGARGAIDAIVPLHPDLLHRELIKPSGEWKYIYRDPLHEFRERVLLADDVFIVSGRLDKSVLEFAATNLGHIIAAERYAGFMFSRGAKHQGVLSAKGRLADPTKAALRTALDEYAIDGPRAGRPLLLEDGMTWTDISMTSKDAQMLESQQFSVAQVCRWLRIPLHKVFEMTGATNSSIATQLSTDYVTDSLLGWCERWEQAIWRDLLVDKAFFAKHNLDGLLRGDPKARSEAYAKAIQWGWMTRNEVREREDLNPIDGLDEPLTPANMSTGDEGVARMPGPPGPGSQAVGLLRLHAADAAARVVRREMAAMTKLAERTGDDRTAWRTGVDAFYAEHVDRMAGDLHIPAHAAQRHASAGRTALLADGPAVMTDWLTERVATLTDEAMNQPEIERAA
jgi:HK97 family phage portal protein